MESIKALCILMLLSACTMQTTEVDVVDLVEIEEVSLPLECHTVPTKKEQLCLATTYSPIGPVDDVVFYHRTSDGYLTFINAYQGDIAVHYFYQFSTNGNYLY
jgi:hypothetical protein